MNYWNKAIWILHPDVLAEIRKIENLKDGKLVWQPSLIAGVPDMILNRPYHLSKYAPKEMTAGNYALLFGNLEFYWILDSLDFEIQRADELYKEENKVGFFGYKETDGMPVLESAFARLKISA